MGYTREQLLAHLQELRINFTKYDHPVVLTVEAQAKYVGDVGSALSKNLFLKDKKHRYYIISALPETKVDLKVLSQRLGLGKGGLRMAPEEALGEILQVPLGCVTPFALANESARNVSLILDQGFKSQESCIFHPLANDTSISLQAKDLNKYLMSIGREPAYVDLEANPRVGKDQPPDLAALVPSESIDLPDSTEKIGSLESLPQHHIPADPKPKEVKAKPTKAPAKVEKAKDKSLVGSIPPVPFSDAGQFVEEILDKTSALLLAEITGDSIKQHGEQLGSVVSKTIRKHLSAELKNLAVMFKNTAYTEGFSAGIHYQPKRV
ncbi:prolyl-tRNA synthetase associated domain-containing protein 1 [Punica granatum]|nr:prolyl-tRNA synthetase associated domain-containing protein 1 [Punica granatum]XP_031373731.1 prolyl-tRNA synthetase associated domain-containing protein 1 [Punica granatum]PKI77659.1 hypothetical protein CRG98_001942 [Punica granatum]